MKPTVKLSSKLQISIPKVIRETMQWPAGQQVAFIAKGEAVLLVPVPSLAALQGIAKDANPTGYRDRLDRY